MPSKKNPVPADKAGTKYEKFNNSKRKAKSETAPRPTKQSAAEGTANKA